MGKKYIPSDETRRIITKLAEDGIIAEKIMAYIGIARNTFYKYYKEDYQKAEVVNIAKVTNVVLDLAINERNLSAATFYLKCRGGWRQDGELTEEHKVEKDAIQNINIRVLDAKVDSVDKE